MASDGVAHIAPHADDAAGEAAALPSPPTVFEALAAASGASSDALAGQELPHHGLIMAHFTTGQAHFCVVTQPDLARDDRVRARFDAPEAAVLRTQLGDGLARCPMHANAAAVKDFNGKWTHAPEGASVRPDGKEHVFRRCALKTSNIRLLDFNRQHDVGDGLFVVDGWVATTGMPAALLNGAEAVYALLLTHVFEHVLPKQKMPMLTTLVSAAPMQDVLCRHAFFDFGRPNTAALRNEHFATRVAVDGTALTAAEIAGLPLPTHVLIEQARRVQLLRALNDCLMERWAGGYLFLFRLVAPSCSDALNNALASFAHTLLVARDGEGASLDDLPPASVALPPLPDSTCAWCHEAMGAVRNLCGHCRTVRYHNDACQRAHWPTHKKTCKPAANNAVCVRQMTMVPDSAGPSAAP